MNKNREAAERFAERRRREDAAPRLATVLPALESLTLEIAEQRVGIPLNEASHIRRVVVARAPALFELPCQEPLCQDGGHDLTNVILRALRERTPRFEGEDRCRGRVGSTAAECTRVVHFVATATYKDPGQRK